MSDAHLHAHVRAAHEAPLTATGNVDVVHGDHALTPLFVRVLKLPAAGAAQAVSLRLGLTAPASAPATMTWPRQIGNARLGTRQFARDGCLVEQSGPGVIEFSLRVDEGELCYEQARFRLLNAPLPSIWCPAVRARVGPNAEGWYEYRLRLPHAGTATELRLHAARDFADAVIIGSLGFVTWMGAWAWVLAALLLMEVAITLWDFIEEDRVRTLPAGERAMHAVMGIVYGAFLANLVPEMLRWSGGPTGFGRSDHGFPAWVLSALAVGVCLSGVRDLFASRLRFPA